MDFEKAEEVLRQSWEVHRQAFGPILEPAFEESPQIRVRLIAALNHLSRREIRRGMEILKELSPHCVYDEDKAAWTFFVGLGFEMAGAREQMLQWYAAAGQYNHRFHLPYMKLARAAHGDGRFEEARGYYEKAIDCLQEMSENDRDEAILGSAYTNLCSCLTMLHRYPEAEAAWHKSRSHPQQPGADATAAILYAAMGDAEKTAAHLEQLREKYPAWLERTKTMTQEILTGVHPSFPPER